MDLHILPNKSSIMAAIALMTPPARDAAQLLAYRITNDNSLLTDRQRLQGEWLQACSISFARSGGNPVRDKADFESFLANHGGGILNVAFSIIHVSAKDAKRRKWVGWLGKAAAVGAGAAIAAFFG